MREHILRPLSFFVLVGLALPGCGGDAGGAHDLSVADQAGVVDGSHADGAVADGAAADGGFGGEILSYSFGNQIFGSLVTIAADGTITHGERDCCPPKTTPKGEAPLVASALALLRARITAARATAPTTASYTTADGAEYGQLTVHDTDGTLVTLRDYAMGTQHGNPSSEAAAIVALVNGYATHDMP